MRNGNSKEPPRCTSGGGRGERGEGERVRRSAKEVFGMKHESAMIKQTQKCFFLPFGTLSSNVSIYIGLAKTPDQINSGINSEVSRLDEAEDCFTAVDPFDLTTLSRLKNARC